MTSDKTIYFLAGLPRSGSTLLANILAQNPHVHVTPTSGIVDMLVTVRNGWDRNDAFQAMAHGLSEQVKERVLRAMLQAYFAHVSQPLCIDKNRYWAEFLEMAAVLVGGRERVKVLVTVRDLRDVLASFEQLYRKTSALGQLPQEAATALKFKTALGRVEVFADDAQPVGRAYNAIRDAVTRGWNDCMHFVDYDALTRAPQATLEGIYRFLGETSYAHDFEHVRQVTFEDDYVYGFKDMHTIRARVEPQPPQWPRVFDDAVLQSPVWRNIDGAARFWQAYLNRPAG
ncbi:MAG TPA: sulfotransferase [Gammaproteobacteria bacterium]|nr:sulfotransferase [Gammaproteobacteria bacterium]